MIRIFTSLFLFLSGFLTFGQTFNGIGGDIIDNTTVYFTIPVSGLIPNIDTTFGLESVCINVTHTWDADLTFILVAPDGTQATLASGVGGGDDDFNNTCFDDTSAIPIIQGSAPFAGSYTSLESLGIINNGQSGNGTWYLYVNDNYPADAGFLYTWSITFGNHPAKPFPFTSSDLPIVVINTHGQQIVDDPKIVTDFGIINNGPGIRNYLTDTFQYNGYSAIEFRGSSSQSFPKKSYGFETCDSTGIEMNASLLGMPLESDWILNANYTDKTLMRNFITYRLWENMGHYGSRTKYCELIINGAYKGIYVLQEKIKRNFNRVNISKLTTLDNSGDQLTGGYIIKIDKSTGSGGDGWVSDYPPIVNPNGQTIFFQYEYPDMDVITVTQKNYIQAFIDSFETALHAPDFSDTLTGFWKYTSERSFIDFFIINELSKNVDGYRLSTYLFKDKTSKGGKLKIGPVWDFDIAWHNADYCGGNDVQGWAYQFPCDGDNWQVPYWWQRFLQDPVFVNKLRCRWEELRTDILSLGYLTDFADSIASLLNESKNRNFKLWPILGIWIWPNPSPIPTTYQGEVDNFKEWITNRLNWLDANIPGVCISNVNTNSDLVNISIFPNPSRGNFTVQIPAYDIADISIQVIDALGRRIQANPNTYSKDNTLYYSFDLNNHNDGMYFIRVSSDDKVIYKKFILVH